MLNFALFRSRHFTPGLTASFYCRPQILVGQASCRNIQSEILELRPRYDQRH